MAKFLGNIRCPECAKRGRDRSGNNLGMYDDGSGHCWSCGYYVHATIGGRINALRGQPGKTLVTDKERSDTVLPEDSDIYIPAVARVWLGKYGITENDIIINKLLWSEYKKYLIFPYFDNHTNLVGWQGRYFGETKKHPKWVGHGDLIKLYHILPSRPQHDTIVLVEDIVSAIQVSKVQSCMPLFGSHIAPERAIRLSKMCSNVVIWLDPDKRRDSLRFKSRCETYGLRAKVVFTDKDPKEYPTKKIMEILTNENMANS